jgi:hypothetical protein
MLRTKVLDVKWVKCSGNVFRPGLATCVKVENELPVFAVIQTFFIKDEQVLFITTALETICLNEHVHAYKVLHTSEAPFVLDIKVILYHRIFDILMSYRGDTDLFSVP